MSNFCYVEPLGLSYPRLLGQNIPGFVSLMEKLPIGGGDGKAFESLTLDSMRKFNEETPDDPNVHYFSWGAKFEPGVLDALGFG